MLSMSNRYQKFYLTNLILTLVDLGFKQNFPIFLKIIFGFKIYSVIETCIFGVEKPNKGRKPPLVTEQTTLLRGFLKKIDFVCFY